MISTIISLLAYGIAGAVMASGGITYKDWQLYVVMTCIVVVDAARAIKK